MKKNLVAGILAGVVLFGCAGMAAFASNGFTEKDITQWTLSVRNEDNLFEPENYTVKSTKIDKASVTITNDGRIMINGENTQDTEDEAKIAHLSLPAGEYTFASGWKDASYKTAYLKFVTSGRTYVFDLGDTDGVHTFASDVEGDVYLVLAKNEEFNKIEMRPTVAAGDDVIDFYK